MKLFAFSKTYGDKTVLSFDGAELEKGKIYGVIGPNGSGKSTFAKILAGVADADKKGKASDIASVGYMPQQSYAFRMTTLSNILLGSGDKVRAEKLMDAFSLRGLENARADRLSGGETARMALCRLMMKSFELVILDEPTAAMDMESTLVAEKLIRDYVEETGCALVLITHSLSQARRLSDELMFFCGGRLTEHGETEPLIEHPARPETKMFLELYGV